MDAKLNDAAQIPYFRGIGCVYYFHLCVVVF